MIGGIAYPHKSHLGKLLSFANFPLRLAFPESCTQCNAIEHTAMRQHV